MDRPCGNGSGEEAGQFKVICGCRVNNLKPSVCWEYWHLNPCRHRGVKENRPPKSDSDGNDKTNLLFMLSKDTGIITDNQKIDKNIKIAYKTNNKLNNKISNKIEQYNNMTAKGFIK